MRYLRIAGMTALGIAPAAVSLFAFGAGEKKDRSTPTGPKAVPVAILGETAITEAELDELAKERLVRLRSEEYQIKKQVLDAYVTRRLLEDEAKARGITVGELQKSEIDDKVDAVTDEQKRAVLESSPEQFQNRSEADAFAQIEANLKRARSAEARSRFLVSLRAKTPVKILLEPPRIAVATDGGPAFGPAAAPVTIVEFSDFQCPACARVSPTVKRVLHEYKDKVRLVFRNFPLPGHPQAAKAAEAAACASEQRKFWPMHDWMFANQGKLAVADLKAAAAELGLNSSRFNTCLDSQRYASDWRADVSDGRRYGVSATPTFFVNGRLMSGALSYQAFVDVIGEELSRRPERAAP